MGRRGLSTEVFRKEQRVCVCVCMRVHARVDVRCPTHRPLERCVFVGGWECVI